MLSGRSTVADAVADWRLVEAYAALAAVPESGGWICSARIIVAWFLDQHGVDPDAAIAELDARRASGNLCGSCLSAQATLRRRDSLTSDDGPACPSCRAQLKQQPWKTRLTWRI